MNCYQSERQIKKMDLLVGVDNDFDLTRNRVYVALDNPGYNMVTIKNDKGIVEVYSTEYFKFYNGETIGY